MSGIRVKLVDVDNRLSIKYDKTDEIYNWGDDNAYPQLIKSLVGSSVSAKRCSDISAKYMYGKGWEFAGKSTIVNKEGHTINQLFNKATKEFAVQNNLFFHVNYNALYEIISVKLLPSTDVRIGKSDSRGYSGKYVVYDNWDRKKNKSIKKDDFTVIDRFNPNPDVIENQVKVAGGWQKYKGQILHVTADFDDLYSLSDADCVLHRMDGEFCAGVYGATGLRYGYFGSQILSVLPFSDDDERREFENCINDLQGMEAKRKILLLEANNVSDDLTKQFDIKNIDDNIDADKYEKTEMLASDAIITAFGVPAILVKKSDNSVFGNSGELITQAKLQFWEEKEEERIILSEAFQTIFSRWHENINPENNWNIIPIITLEKTAQSNE